MNGKHGLMNLNIEGKPIDMYIRKTPHGEENEQRGRTNKNGTWYDKGVVFKLRTNPHFQDAEAQVTEFAKSFKKFMLNKTVKAVLLEGIKEGMSSTKLLKKLENKNADYWKLWRGVDPTIRELESLDEILCDEGITLLLRTCLKHHLENSASEMGDDLTADLYSSGSLPIDTETLFE